ncbi:class I adenylate-forming enzyme family protein [Bradyrhizobium yuanmingense]|uniref:class I adenylate-forming enzyme family protein n=1 Tax=Bradyrhizobium yuanmingense TaxID=108015 RepID=UPI0023B9640D|nr:class I adenylate-forming enzyme family protein [Bradyrhizobium yuanmingense]MDF0581966.1 class I adenylate-forming enzyme family protein [Bradyrhizobium yuanmingense]
MPTTNVRSSQLRDRVANAVRRGEALESAYQTTTIGELVSMRARTHGSTVAVDIFERGERATYSEMDVRSNRCAHALRAFGVRKGDRVGVMLPNRIEFPVVWFALAKLGAVMVPIDMQYTPREIEYIIRETQCKFAVVDESKWAVFGAVDRFPQDLTRERLILVGNGSGKNSTLDQLTSCAGDSPVYEAVHPTDLLTIQYTSGTTDVPKGCMLTHEYWSVCSYEFAYLSPFKRYLSWASSSYAYGPGILLMSYRQGGTVYIAQRMEPSQFMDWLAKYRIEWCALPRQIADSAKAVPSSLKQVSQYDGWSTQTIHRFRDGFGVRSYYPWGMTETGIGTQMLPDLEDINEAGLLGIRSPFRDLRMVNDDGTATPVGEVGELWVKGRGMFKGYWKRSEASAAYFEGEWFKTGDLVRRNDLGLYWFVGRKKDIIRRFSDNISACEVQAIIREIPEVEDVAAVPIRDDKRGEEVKIYVELKKGLTPADLSVESILGHAGARLAAFKVPRYIAFISRLPRTVASNKVLKRELMAVTDPLSNTYDAEERRWS